MDYELVINGSPILSGSVLYAGTIVALVVIILAVIAGIFWRRIRESETMKYEFITIIAHKFRTPLTSIKWLLENMIPSEADPTKKEGLAEMKASDDKLISLTGTLIELTNLDNENRAAYAWETVVICDFVKIIADAHKDIFHRKNIFISLQCADPGIKVSIDKTRMEFVLQTVMENACIYSPPGRNVEVIVAKKGRKAVLAVVDHGIGIEKNDLPKLFGKFYRTKAAQNMDTEGFGVGLFLAQSIMKRHKGKIRAYSAGRDQGSTFTVTLPLAKK